VRCKIRVALHGGTWHVSLAPSVLWAIPFFLLRLAGEQAAYDRSCFDPIVVAKTDSVCAVSEFHSMPVSRA
jgi:hypothetical protein